MGGKNGIVLTTKKRWFPNSLSIPSAFQSLLGRGLAASLEILAKSVPPSLYSAAGTEWERRHCDAWERRTAKRGGFLEESGGFFWDFNGFH